MVLLVPEDGRPKRLELQPCHLDFRGTHSCHHGSHGAFVPLACCAPAAVWALPLGITCYHAKQTGSVLPQLSENRDDCIPVPML
jgi:hypothetical protein